MGAMALDTSVQQLARARTVSEVAGVALDAIKKAFSAHVGATILLDRSAEPSAGGVFGVSDAALEDYICNWRGFDAVFSEVLARAEPVHYLQVYSKEAWEHGPIMRGYARRHGILHYMSGPIYGSRGRLVGVMNFCRPPRYAPFRAGDLRMAAVLSGFVSAAIARVESGPPECAGRGCDGLAPRELQVSQLAAAGHNNLAIALRLGIARETVKQTLRRVYRKLNVTGRAQMAATLAARGLLDDDVGRGSGD